MFVLVKVDSQVTLGDVLNWDSTSSSWNVGSDLSITFGVAREDAYTLDGSNYIARVSFAGSCQAKAGADIPEQGGKLASLNGKVIVDDNSVNEVGFITPNPFGQQPRLANDLVLIYIR